MRIAELFPSGAALTPRGRPDAGLCTPHVHRLAGGLPIGLSALAARRATYSSRDWRVTLTAAPIRTVGSKPVAINRQ